MPSPASLVLEGKIQVVCRSIVDAGRSTVIGLVSVDSQVPRQH